MFGLDWDGDGKDGLIDDMITMDILDDDKDNFCGGGKTNGSCLLFLIAIGSVVALPVVGLVKFLV